MRPGRRHGVRPGRRGAAGCLAARYHRGERHGHRVERPDADAAQGRVALLVRQVDDAEDRPVVLPERQEPLGDGQCGRPAPALRPVAVDEIGAARRPRRPSLRPARRSPARRSRSTGRTSPARCPAARAMSMTLTDRHGVVVSSSTVASSSFCRVARPRSPGTRPSVVVCKSSATDPTDAKSSLAPCPILGPPPKGAAGPGPGGWPPGSSPMTRHWPPSSGRCERPSSSRPPLRSPSPRRTRTSSCSRRSARSRCCSSSTSPAARWRSSARSVRSSPAGRVFIVARHALLGPTGRGRADDGRRRLRGPLRRRAQPARQRRDDRSATDVRPADRRRRPPRRDPRPVGRLAARRRPGRAGDPPRLAAPVPRRPPAPSGVDRPGARHAGRGPCRRAGGPGRARRGRDRADRAPPPVRVDDVPADRRRAWRDRLGQAGRPDGMGGDERGPRPPADDCPRAPGRPGDQPGSRRRARGRGRPDLRPPRLPGPRRRASPTGWPRRSPRSRPPATTASTPRSSASSTGAAEERATDALAHAVPVGAERLEGSSAASSRTGSSGRSTRRSAPGP